MDGRWGRPCILFIDVKLGVYLLFKCANYLDDLVQESRPYSLAPKLGIWLGVEVRIKGWGSDFGGWQLPRGVIVGGLVLHVGGLVLEVRVAG